jgi:hypothetical protein
VPAALGNDRYEVTHQLGYKRTISLVRGSGLQCKCSTCVSKRLPCKYMVAVCNFLNEDPKKPCYVNSRWLLKKHPLFKEALRNLSLSAADHGFVPDTPAAPAEAAPPAPVVTYGSTFSVPREHYDKVEYPSDKNRQHHNLDYLAREVVTLGKGSRHQFKLAMAALAATKAKLVEARDNGGHDARPSDAGKRNSPPSRTALLPPPNKVARRNEATDSEAMRVTSHPQLLFQAVTGCNRL